MTNPMQGSPLQVVTATPAPDQTPSDPRPVHISLMTGRFMLGLIATGRFQTVQGKYQAAIAQRELEEVLGPFVQPEPEPQTRAERRRQEKA